MKVRRGFVSNSSTSSFLVVGWEIDRDLMSREEIIGAMLSEEVLNAKSQRLYQKDWADLDSDERSDLLDGELSVLDHEEQGAPRGKTIIGHRVGGDFESGFSVKMDDLLRRAQNISIPPQMRESLSGNSEGELGKSPAIRLDLKPGDLRLFGGTRMS